MFALILGAGFTSGNRVTQADTANNQLATDVAAHPGQRETGGRAAL